MFAGLAVALGFQCGLFNIGAEGQIKKSWEADIWVGETYPSYLYHNLFEDEVANTTLFLQEALYRMIEHLYVKIESYYEGLNLLNLPKACFELDSETRKKP